MPAFRGMVMCEERSRSGSSRNLGLKRRAQRKKNSVIREGLVSTDSVTSHTSCDFTGLRQGAAVLALQIFCVRGKWDFSTPWVLPGSFPEERS